jgi:hypothetical protein
MLLHPNIDYICTLIIIDLDLSSVYPLFLLNLPSTTMTPTMSLQHLLADYLAISAQIESTNQVAYSALQLSLQALLSVLAFLLYQQSAPRLALPPRLWLSLVPRDLAFSLVFS